MARTWLDPASARLMKGAGTVPLSRGRGPVVLMYHSLSAGLARRGWEWALSPRSFRAQLELLSRFGWNTVCVTDLLKPADLPAKTVAITFDDGYLDTFENGFAVLREMGMRATWYVVTRDLGSLAGWDDGAPEPGRLLSADHLREMSAGGMEIGAHSRTHRELPPLTEVECMEEVRGSKEDLQDLLGTAVSTFAYPFGKHGDATVDTVRRAGYRSACVTLPGWLGLDPDPLRIRRVTVYGHDSLGRFARKLAFANNEVGWGRMVRYAMERARARLGGDRG